MRKFYMSGIALLLVIAGFAQPTVFFTNLTSTTNPVLTSSRLSLTDLGTFRQCRFQTTAAPTPATQTYAFHIGTPGSPDYNANWRPYNMGDATGIAYALNTVTVPATVANSARYNGFGGGNDGNLAALANNTYYTVNIQENAGIDNLSAIWSTTFNPATYSGITQTPAAGSVNPGNTVDVNITSSGTLGSGENVYVRYSANAFVNSYVVQATFVGTSGFATLPGQASGVTVSYYIFSSNRSLAQLNTIVSTTGIGQAGYDMATLNLNNNAGANYSYTVNAGANPITVNATGGALTADYGSLQTAFDAINAGTHTGAITVLVNASTTEIASCTLNASGVGAAAYTNITVSPAGGGARTVSGAIISAPLINLDGADNVTINGLNSGGNTLTLTNTSSGSSSTIRFINDATGNTITNCIIKGSGTSFGPVHFSTGTVTGNDNNTISNSDIGPAGISLPLYGVYSFGTSTAIDNSGNTLSGNNVFDYFSSGSATSGININSGNSGWTINGNKLYQTANRLYTTASTHNGIFITSGSGYTINNNVLGYASSAGTGTTNIVGNSIALGGTFPSAYTTGGTPNATRYVAINAGFTAGGTVSNIQGNTIAGYALFTSSGATTTTGIFCAIAVTSGNANIGTTTGNTIGTATSSVYTASSTTGGLVAGIYTSSTNTIFIQNNTIQNIDAMGTTASFCGTITGINAAGSALYTITGNTIGSTTSPSLRMGNLTTGASLSNVGTTFGTSTGSGLFQGILHSSTNAAASVIGTAAAPNIIRNATLNTSSASTTLTAMRGIAVSGGLANVTKNSISDLTSASTSTASGSFASVNGISITSGTSGQLISQNTVQSLSNSTATAAVVINGIFWNNNTNAPIVNIIEKNLVQNNTVSSAGAAVLNGIYDFNGGATFRHNMILLGTNAAGVSLTSGTLIINGILGETVSTASNNFYHNSVLISGTGVGAGTASTFAFKRIVTEILTDVRNNIFVNNRSNGAGTGKHYNASLNAMTGVAINYNNYNQTGTGAVQGVIGATDYATLAAWQTGTTQEAASLFADPQFISTTNLHINTGNCLFKGLGTPITGITDDFDNNGRSATAPDMGADEFNPAATPSTTLAGTIAAGATVNQSVRYTITGSTDYLFTCNKIIATINPVGASPVAGNVTTDVRADTGATKMGTGALYAARFYALEPVANAATSTARVTLYYLQSEFDNFNTKAVDSGHYTLPAGPADVTGIGNLLIRQFHGTPTGGYFPGNYAGAIEDLDPADADIVWNATLGRWEVTVPVSSFSGFFLTSKIIIVPVRFTNISARATGTSNTVYWTTEQEQNNQKFVVERSINGRDFAAIGEVATKAVNGNSSSPISYTFADANPYEGKAYYRLRQADRGGQEHQSPIVTVVRGRDQLEIVDVRPNPATNKIYFNIIGGSNNPKTVVVRSLDGKELMRSVQQPTNSFSLDMSAFASGLYLLEATDTGSGEKAIFKVVKQ
jgi:trimeric autotransporter adhesin